MFDTMTRYLEGIKEVRFRNALRPVLKPLVDRYSSQPLTSAGLVISAGGATVAKIGAANFYAVAAGVLVEIAAGTAMPALTGINITAAYFNVVCFYVNNAGVVTAAAGTQSATLGGVLFPQTPDGSALVGFLIINYASTFTAAPRRSIRRPRFNVSPLGPCDPTMLV